MYKPVDGIKLCSYTHKMKVGASFRKVRLPQQLRYPTMARSAICLVSFN